VEFRGVGIDAVGAGEDGGVPQQVHDDEQDHEQPRHRHQDLPSYRVREQLHEFFLLDMDFLRSRDRWRRWEWAKPLQSQMDASPAPRWTLIDHFGKLRQAFHLSCWQGIPLTNGDRTGTVLNC